MHLDPATTQAITIVFLVIVAVIAYRIGKNDGRYDALEEARDAAAAHCQTCDAVIDEIARFDRAIARVKTVTFYGSDYSIDGPDPVVDANFIIDNAIQHLDRRRRHQERMQRYSLEVLDGALTKR